MRLAFGVLCLYVLWELFYYREWTSTQPVSSLDNRFLVLLAPLCIANYVVNIGFSKSWEYRPLMVSIVVLGVLGGIAFVVSGGLDSPILGIPLNLWLGYFYGHLGLAFVLSALIATPGCEMRAIPELFGRMRGKPSEEHHCPAAFITKIDEWEHSRTSG
jgi:predicted transporter